MDAVSQTINLEIRSPVIEAMEGLGYTRLEVAGAVGISLTTVEYTEKGMFASIPERILELLEVFNSDLPRDYRNWQVLRRRQAKLPREMPEGFPLCGEVMHPHREWRELVCEMPVNVYCEELCLPRFSIQKFEAGRQSIMPSSLKQALFLACGGDVATELTRACGEWEK